MIILYSCHEKNMTLEELSKAPWTRLDRGLDYINLKSGNSSPDSIIYILKGRAWSDPKMLEEDFHIDQLEVYPLLNEIVKPKLSNSQHGYLRLNLHEMLMSDTTTVHVILCGDLDSADLANTLQWLEKKPGVFNVEFISKEKAKKKYLADGNENWDKVLDSNPLPNIILMNFNSTKVTADNLEKLKTEILDSVIYVSDVEYPKTPSGQQSFSYYFEYKRL
jgi:hypothetical protein